MIKVSGWLRAAVMGLLLTPILLALGCRATPTPSPRVHLRVACSDSTQYIARELAQAYRLTQPATSFDFDTTNSTAALRQMALSEFDMAFIEKNPTAAELERARAIALELGRDGVMIIVHPSNQLSNLSREDAAKIFSGEFTLWSELGIPPPGNVDEIQALSREDGSGIRLVIQDEILKGRRITPTSLVRPSNLDTLEWVAEHPNAIGYVAANVWSESSGTKPLNVDDIAPTRATIQDGSYPLTQSVFLIVPESSPPDLAGFLDFLTTPEARQTLYSRIAELAK